MRREGRFSPAPEAVREARHFADAALAGCPPAVRDRVSLMVSELATNAVQHAGTGFVVAIDIADDIRVEVRDSGPGRPEVRRPSPDASSGRGLLIVQSLAESWGVQESPEGCTVWFSVGLT